MILCNINISEKKIRILYLCVSFFSLNLSYFEIFISNLFHFWYFQLKFLKNLQFWFIILN